jgi:hypothetical protein
MHRREFLLSATGIVGATTVGSMAYTSASVTRSVTANVAADDSSIIQLDPGGSVDAASLNGNQLEINVTEALNQDGTFEYGDYSDPSTTPVFTITNQDDASRNISVSITDNSGSISLKLDEPDDSTTTVTDGTPSGTISLAGTTNGPESIQVALQIDTTGVSTGPDAIDADITISAN